MFCFKQKENGGTLIKNTLTGSVVYMSNQMLQEIDDWLGAQDLANPDCVDDLTGKNGMLVSVNIDELSVYKKIITRARNGKDAFFTLHLLPTMKCQLQCPYCFENGINKKSSMSKQILFQSVRWLSRYLEVNTNISALRLVFFGGEPLLRKNIIRLALPLFSNLAKKHRKKFFCEIITNGELLDKKIAGFLFQHNWKRAQITLDGDKDAHNQRRFGKNNRPTFNKIIENMRMILDLNFIEKVDVRINFDLLNADSIPALINFLAKLGYQDRMDLTFAFVNLTVTKRCSSGECKIKTTQDSENSIVSKNYLRFCQIAKTHGFSVPEEMVAGPLCIATIKHSVVIQPDGNLQKCFCSVGRPKYNFGHVLQLPVAYAKDRRFEMFEKRTRKCKEKKCPYLPICGGGCIWDSVCSSGKSGLEKPFCQKSLLSSVNQGLLRLNYGN